MLKSAVEAPYRSPRRLERASTRKFSQQLAGWLTWKLVTTKKASFALPDFFCPDRNEHIALVGDVETDGLSFFSFGTSKRARTPD